MYAATSPMPSGLPVVTGLGSLALALAVAGPVAANPFGVERQGGDAIAAIRSLTPEQAREFVSKRTDMTARIDTGKAALAFARGGVTAVSPDLCRERHHLRRADRPRDALGRHGPGPRPVQGVQRLASQLD